MLHKKSLVRERVFVLKRIYFFLPKTGKKKGLPSMKTRNEKNRTEQNNKGTCGIIKQNKQQ